MKLYIFSVFDRKVEAFMTPFFARSRGEAMRSFMDACSDGKHNFVKYPNDFELCQLGWFDDDNGNIGAELKPLMVASDAVKSSEADVAGPTEQLTLRAARGNSGVC